MTNSDKQVFVSVGIDTSMVDLTFKQQLDVIKRVQNEIFRHAPLSNGEGIPEYQLREPADLMRFGKGLCFDRSRTFDKVYSYLGFRSRHVFILYKEDAPFLTALFHRGHASHAVTEVKTIKGWMFVDSNVSWVAVTRNGEPVSADDVWRRFSEFDDAPPYLAYPWWAIRGLYSRKGQFYGSFLPVPELNWKDFFDWLLFG